MGKSVPRVPVWHHLALPRDAKTMTLTLMSDSYSNAEVIDIGSVRVNTDRGVNTDGDLQIPIRRNS